MEFCQLNKNFSSKSFCLLENFVYNTNMKKKRTFKFFSILFCMLIAICTIPFSTQRAVQTATDDVETQEQTVTVTTADKNWSDSDNKTGIGNLKQDKNVYLITSGGDLASMADNLGGSYRLTCDIDLSDYYWTPIGTSDSAFSGEFDGGGYSISGLTIRSYVKVDDASNEVGDESFGTGLFGAVSGSVHDFTLTGNISIGVDYSDIYATSFSIGPAIAYTHDNETDQDIYNISNSADNFTVQTVNVATNYIGGVIGGNTSSTDKVYNLANYASMTVINKINNQNTMIVVGGVVGGVHGHSQDGFGDPHLNACSNHGDIEIENSSPIILGCLVGGVVGASTTNGDNAHVVIKNCTNEGKITLTGSATLSGSNAKYIYVFGKESNLEAGAASHSRFCSSHIPVAIGGIIALGTWNLSVENCHNYADINCPATFSLSYDKGVTYSIGGIVGFNRRWLMIQSCFNSGNITSEHNYCFVAGICGSYDVTNDARKDNSRIQDCVNIGTITGTGEDGVDGEYAGSGGILGYSYDDILINRCVNYGHIVGGRSAGISSRGGECWDGGGIFDGHQVISQNPVRNCVNAGEVSSNVGIRYTDVKNNIRKNYMISGQTWCKDPCTKEDGGAKEDDGKAKGETKEDLFKQSFFDGLKNSSEDTWVEGDDRYHVLGWGDTSCSFKFVKASEWVKDLSGVIIVPSSVYLSSGKLGVYYTTPNAKDPQKAELCEFGTKTELTVSNYVNGKQATVSVTNDNGTYIESQYKFDEKGSKMRATNQGRVTGYSSSDVKITFVANYTISRTTPIFNLVLKDEGGSFSVSGDNTASYVIKVGNESYSSGPVTIYHGDKVSIKITPNNGYCIERLTLKENPFAETLKNKIGMTLENSIVDNKGEPKKITDKLSASGYNYSFTQSTGSQAGQIDTYGALTLSFNKRHVNLTELEYSITKIDYTYNVTYDDGKSGTITGSTKINGGNNTINLTNNNFFQFGYTYKVDIYPGTDGKASTYETFINQTLPEGDNWDSLSLTVDNKQGLINTLCEIELGENALEGSSNFDFKNAKKAVQKITVRYDEKYKLFNNETWSYDSEDDIYKEFNSISSLYFNFANEVRNDWDGASGHIYPSSYWSLKTLYSDFYDKAMMIFANSPTSTFASESNKNTNGLFLDMNKGWVCSYLSSGEYRPNKVDYTKIVAKLFGYDSAKDFANASNGKYKKASEAGAGNNYYYVLSSDKTQYAYFFPVAITSSASGSDNTVLMYVIVYCDGDGAEHVYVLVNDYKSLLDAVNYESDNTNSVNIRMYCKNRIFGTNGNGTLYNSFTINVTRTLMTYNVYVDDYTNTFDNINTYEKNANGGSHSGVEKNGDGYSVDNNPSLVVTPNSGYVNAGIGFGNELNGNGATATNITKPIDSYTLSDLVKDYVDIIYDTDHRNDWLNNKNAYIQVLYGVGSYTLNDDIACIGGYDNGASVTITGGIVKGNKRTVYYTEPVTGTAKDGGSARFVGWYSGKTLLSLSPTYTFTINYLNNDTSEFTITARFASYTSTKTQLENKSITIGSADELIAFSASVNSGKTYKNCVVRLVADIDISGKTFNPIGSKNNSFEGIFEGNNHIISNLSLVGGDYQNNLSYMGLFGHTSGATIRNLTLKGMTYSGFSYVGAFVGYAENTTLKHLIAYDTCYSLADVTIGTIEGLTTTPDKSVRNYIAGIAGYATGCDISVCCVDLQNENKVFFIKSTTTQNLTGTTTDGSGETKNDGKTTQGGVFVFGDNVIYGIANGAETIDQCFVNVANSSQAKDKAIIGTGTTMTDYYFKIAGGYKNKTVTNSSYWFEEETLLKAFYWC